MRRRPQWLLILMFCLTAVYCDSQETIVAEAAGATISTTSDDGLEIGESVPIDPGESDTVTTQDIPSVVPGNEAPAPVDEGDTASTTDSADIASENGTSKEASDAAAVEAEQSKEPVQLGPFIDLLGPHLLSLEMIDATHAQLQPHYTSEALRNKKVVGIYFSADWCGPCRKFTPELVSFFDKINNRRGKQNEFEIVWVSRCRDVNAFGQYFTQMGKWFALPPEEAMGERGKMLSDKYKVKSIPTLVLLDDLGNVITRDGRNKIPVDKNGIGFPWRNPIANIYVALLPRSIRMMIKAQVVAVKDKLFQRVIRIMGLQR